ncbi:MAG: M24 family metallopeptidase [Oscillospiraceae bacterium]
MQQNMILEFPVSEYENRIKNLTAGMKQRGMDAVLLTMPSNVRYFSGLRTIVWASNSSIPGVLVIDSDGNMRIISSKSNSNTVRVSTCIEEKDLVIFKAGSDIPTFNDALNLVLHGLKLDNAVIGVEYGDGFRIRMTMEHYDKMREEFKNASFVDAAQLLWDIRCVKSPLEIERMRKASRIASRAFDAAFDIIVPGRTTEDEVFRYMASQCFQMGAEEMLQLELHGRKDRYANYNCAPSDLPFGTERGTMITIDGGPSYKGYYSDITRVGVIGGPTDRQKELFKIAMDGFAAALEALRPGRTADEVCRMTDKWFDDAGVGDIFVSRGWIGHCLGLDVHENPCLCHGDYTVIRPGMVFAVEPFIFNDVDGSFGIEENLVVTENGVELLSDAYNGLYCVG